MIQDLRYACRALIAHRGYAGAMIATLALGLGVNTAVATVAWSVLLRPMPIADPDRVVLVYPAYPNLQRLRQPIPFPKFNEWRARNDVFHELAAMTPVTLDGLGDIGDSVAVAAVSDGFFQVLGVPAAEGRLLGAGDRNGTEGGVACVLSAPFARRMFGGSSGIGRRFEIPRPDRPDLRTFLVVVGVMPDGVERWRDRTEVWVPAEAPGILNREQLFSIGHYMFEAVGRLRPDVTPVQARAAMEQLDRRVERELDDQSAPPPPLHVVMLRDDVVPAAFQRMLWLFALAAVLVLAIAAANASSLALARLDARLADVLIRRALGASPAAMFRYVFAETTVLAALGALAGVPLAYWSLRVLGAFAPVGISGQVVRFSAAVAAFIALLTLATAAAMAALQHGALWRLSSDSTLHGAAASPRQASRRLDALVAIEIAMSVLVVIAGGLLVRNVVRLQHTDPGFEPHVVLVVSGTLEDERHADQAASGRGGRMASLFGVILERAAGIAGVETAAVGMRTPLDGRPARRASIVLEDGSRLLNGDPHNFAKTPDLLRVSPRYFETLGIPLRAGRVFRDEDDHPRAPVVIVNETMAKLQWPGEGAVGRRVKYLNLNASAPWAEVIGVVGDIRSESLHDPPRPEMYAPLNELSGMAGQLRIFLKTRADPRALAPRAMTDLGDAHPRLRLRRVETLQDVVASSMGEQQYQAELIGMFALLALVLASVGVYGLLNYAVTRRRREMAIRMALGASSSDVAALIARRGAVLVFPGLTAGLVLASASTRVMQGLLFDISPTDPATFAIVPLLFVALAFAAGVAPTRRATSLDPAIALREE